MAKGTDEHALTKAAGIMLAGADFIERRAAKDGDGCCREVIIRLDEKNYSRLVNGALAARATPSAIARAALLTSMDGGLKLPPKGSDKDQPGGPTQEEINELRRRLVEARKKAVAEKEQTDQLAKELSTAVSEKRAALDDRDRWRDALNALEDQLQEIGETFGVEPGEPRVSGIRRVLSAQQTEIQRLTREAEAARVPAPSPRAAPAPSKAFLKLVASYRWTGSTPAQIATALGASIEEVRRAIDINSWNKS